MSEGMISANLAGVLESRSHADQASTATTDGGSKATTAADATQQQLTDISTTLRTGFTQNIEALQAQFTNFRSTVNSSNWDGNAKNRANGIVDHYESLLRTVAGEATTAVTEFATQTNKEAQNLRDGIGTEYKGITDKFADRYKSLGTALQNYHDNLDNLDNAAMHSA
ncbi:hypothetical protein KSP35_00730 [Aquihabitans sp. G128]|uniref:hypothetical protein n=1 Tax=Aquihabitans sp. G128 TaxID=2849779 RepID=UPI001C21D64B|nr:hypothetical protein [Aquihabitans sp. G128]QXC61412.1 hypothetical protein KSP35_00730 [Aquihabitans sp. G128]